MSFARRAIRLWLWIGVLGCVGSSPSLAGPPKVQRIALIIGHNQGTGGLKPLLYAQRDAQKLARILKHLGGYSSKQIVLLLSPTRKQVMASLKIIRKRVAHFGKKSLFLFYYSGHAKGTHFQLGKESLPFSSIWRFARSLPVKVRLMMIDSCFSGRFLRSKGPRRVSTIKWVPPQDLRSRGLAILASSGADGRSYESDKIQGSLFTSSLLAGLRGAADKDQDQRVSLSELRQYVYRQTLTRSSRSLHLQRPAHRIELRGQGPLFLSYLRRAQSQLLLPKKLEGHVFVYRGQTLLQDIQKAKGSALRLGLQQGSYKLQVRRGRWLGKYQFAVSPQKKHAVALAKIQWQRLRAQSNSKGTEPGTAPFGLGLLLRYLPVNKLSTHGLGVSLQLDSGRWLRAGLGYMYGPSNLLGATYQTHLLHLQLALGYGFERGPIGFWAGAMLRPLFAIREHPSKTFWNMGFSAGALGHLDYQLTPGWSLRLALSGGINAILFSDNALLSSPAIDIGIGILWKP